jgi:hypothetical protein
MHVASKGEMRNAYKILIGKLKGKREVGLDGRIIKWIRKYRSSECLMDSAGSGSNDQEMRGNFSLEPSTVFFSLCVIYAFLRH